MRWSNVSPLGKIVHPRASSFIFRVQWRYLYHGISETSVQEFQYENVKTFLCHVETTTVYPCQEHCHYWHQCCHIDRAPRTQCYTLYIQWTFLIIYVIGGQSTNQINYCTCVKTLRVNNMHAVCDRIAKAH